MMLECWQFKSDLRPSFYVLNEKLNQILEKYEQRRTELQQQLQSEILYENKLNSAQLNVNIANSGNLIPPALEFTNFSRPSSNLPELPKRLTETVSHKNTPSVTPNCDKLFSNAAQSVSLLGLLNQSQPNRADSILMRKYPLLSENPKLLSPNQSTTSDESKRHTRQSESESDSQYFSGTDVSLLYADSSQFSTASSAYSNYSLPVPPDAIKEASLVAASLAQTPPSPPPLKSLKKLLNVASAAYNL